MDIATLLESHRSYIIDALATDNAKEVVAAAHDRATTKTLLDLYRSGVPVNGEVKPLGQAALTTPVPTPSRRVKAGSKKARERAIKAGETRRKNLAAKANAGVQNANINTPPFTQTDPAGEGGAA